MTSFLDIPPAQRGTMRIGGAIYHYERGSAKIGHALFLAKGPDTRDWAKIDAGAIDYSSFARAEHDMPGFEAHDGPKTQAACPICNSPVGADALPVGDPNNPAVVRAAQVSIATQDHQAGRSHRLPDVAAVCPVCHPKVTPTDTLGPVPDHEPEEVRLRREAREAEAAALAEQAARDNEAKLRLDPEPETAARIAEQVGETREQRIARLERELDNAKAADISAFDQRITQAVGDDAPDLDRYETDNDPFAERDEQGRPVWGIDPWTKAPAKILWRIDGADVTHPYGKKKDGSPRRSGREAT